MFGFHGNEACFSYNKQCNNQYSYEYNSSTIVVSIVFLDMSDDEGLNEGRRKLEEEDNEKEG